MSSIVDWLRASYARTTVIDVKRLDEAAARIEQLEAALREIADWPDDYTMNQAAATARAALEERT